MNYSVFLGPDRRYVPADKWDEYKASGNLALFDLVFKRHPNPRWYLPVLTNGPETYRLGQVFRDRMNEWGCIPGVYGRDEIHKISQKGFATRLRAAEYLMKRQSFTDPEDW